MQIGAPTDPIFHRHLVLGYSFAWLLQLAYLSYAGVKYWYARRDR